MKVLKVLKFAYYLTAFLLFVWFMLSWGDIVADNCSMNPVHHPLNMFVLFFKG